jgi:ribosome-associated protein
MMPVVLPAGSESRSRTKTPDRRAALARSRELAIQCARSCDDFRGKDTVVLEVSHITPLFDYFVITTGTNPRQMRAIAEGADAMMKENDSPKVSVDGRDSSNWIVQDYGDVVLHVFTPEGRSQYDLEGLWGDARRIEW